MGKKRRDPYIDLIAGGVGFSVGAGIIGTLPATPVSATASRSLALGAVTLPIAASGLVLGELDKLVDRKRKRG